MKKVMKSKKTIAMLLTAGMIFGSSGTAMARPSINGVFDAPQVESSKGIVRVEEHTNEQLIEKYQGQEEIVTVIQNINEKIEEAVEKAVNGMGEDITLDKIFKLKSPAGTGGNQTEDEELPKIDLHLFIDNEKITDEKVKEEIVKLDELKILTPVKELVIEGVEPTEEDPVDVTFTANNVTDDIDVFVMHYCDKDGWELLSTKRPSELKDEQEPGEDNETEETKAENVEVEDTDAGDTEAENIEASEEEKEEVKNQVIASFHSLSPVCLVYREKADEKAKDVKAPATK